MFSIPQYDNLSREQLQAEVLEWISNDTGIQSDLVMLDQTYNITLPRTIFLKSLPTGSSVLDVGAGDGGMAIYKDWPLVERQDLELHAISLTEGIHFDRYKSFVLKNFEENDDIYDNLEFNGVICCHFIEHMQTPNKAIEFLAKKSVPGSRLYLEWPHEMTKRLPTRFSVMQMGLDISTLNFFDDDTHIDCWSAEGLIDLLEKNGFSIEGGGRVFMPWIGEQMKNHAKVTNDSVRLTLGTWVAFGWAQYIVASKR